MPAATEFQVNTYTTHDQTHPSITALSDGGFVVTWRSYAQDGSDYGIYGQRYAADGSPSGTEFQVNTYTANWQVSPSVTGLSDGGFVVTWTSGGQDGSDYGIYGQRYAADGTADGDEFQVNTNGTNGGDPSVTELADGGFVVTWTSTDGSLDGIYGQRYDADGIATGAKFQVNTYIMLIQGHSSITGLADGGFVVTWNSDGQDRSGYGIFGQRYSADGIATGKEFRVNTHTNDWQTYPSVTALVNGGFVVTWESDVQDGNGRGIYGQRYAADGTADGDEFLINTFTLNSQINPSVTGLSDGGFVVTWTSGGQDGSGYGIYGQRYDADGNAIDVYVANTSPTGSVTISGTPTEDQTLTASNTLADGDGLGTFSYQWNRDGVEISGATSSTYTLVQADVGSAITATISYTDGYGYDESVTSTPTSTVGDINIGTSGNDTLLGTAGNDTLSGGSGNDSLYMDAGDDSLQGGTGTDWLLIDSSTAATIKLSTSNQQSTGFGSDVIENIENASGGSGDDTIKGTGGHNTLKGNDGNDLLYGRNGDDVLYGDAGNDTLYGDRGADTLYGGTGADTLAGGFGLDTLEGGAGADSFVFNLIGDSGATAATADVINDFVSGTDKINLSAIDASVLLEGNNSFTFDGTTAFSSSTQGEIYYEQFDVAGSADDYTMIYVDNDADAGIEMAIKLVGLHTLTADDFLL
jgi:Ca2+-binding RTX toxin-like protein